MHQWLVHNLWCTIFGAQSGDVHHAETHGAHLFTPSCHARMLVVDVFNILLDFQI